MAEAPGRYPLLALEIVEGAAQVAAARRVQINHAFANAYRDVDGDPSRLSPAWLRQRAQMIHQELAGATPARTPFCSWGALRARRSGAVRPGPTAAHLRLAAWGFSPAPEALRVYLVSVGALAKPEPPPRATV